MRLLLADNHKIVLEGLRSLLEQQPDMQVVGEAENGRDAVRLARELKPDIVITDIIMPELNGIEAARQIVAENPGTRVIALSMYGDKRYVAGMLAAGATGYVLKDSAFAELAHAARVVHDGKVYLSSEIAGVVTSDYVQRLGVTQQVSATSLSGREREVLQLLAEGHCARDIGSRLHLSAKTVETHRRNIMSKLGLHSLAGLTKYALREGVISLDADQLEPVDKRS